MRAAGMKQADVVRVAQERGRKLGKSQVSQYVSGKTLPRRDVLALLADVLGVRSAWLAGEEEGPDPARATSGATEARAARSGDYHVAPACETSAGDALASPHTQGSAPM